jgi:hypothetical protein
MMTRFLLFHQTQDSTPTDVLRTLGGSEFNGDLLNDPVCIDSEELGGKVPVAKAKLISIIF